MAKMFVLTVVVAFLVCSADARRPKPRPPGGAQGGPIPGIVAKEVAEWTPFGTAPADNSYEARRYPSANWAETTVTGVDVRMVARQAMATIKAYFDGANDQSLVLTPTAPLRIEIRSNPCIYCARDFRVSVIIPKSQQAAPPNPTNPAVTVAKGNDEYFYVRRFSQSPFTSPIAQANQLSEDLKRNGVAESQLINSKIETARHMLLGGKAEVWIQALAEP